MTHMNDRAYQLSIGDQMCWTLVMYNSQAQIKEKRLALDKGCKKLQCFNIRELTKLSPAGTLVCRGFNLNCQKGVARDPLN